MDEYAVSVHGLRKRYPAPGPYRGDRRRHVAAVDRLQLRIRPGEVYALLGPNGAGKTTTVLRAALICQLAARLGGTVPDLTVHRPTLEDTYLDLIGADQP